MRVRFSQISNEGAYRLSRLVFLALAILSTGPLAHSADIILVQEPSLPPIIAIEGNFEPGDDRKFVEIALPLDHAFVFLNSPGGNVLAAIEIGRAIRLKQFTTFVAGDLYCTSACALAWLGGTKRVMASTAHVGFHAVYVDEGGQIRESGSGNAVVGAYLNQLGLSQNAVAYLTAPPPSTLQWLSPSDARQLGIDVDVFEPSVAGNNSKPPSVDTPVPDLNRLSQVDLYGFDMPNMPLRTLNLAECETRCKAVASCIAFTFSVPNAGCFLKSGVHFAVGNPKAMSGYKKGVEQRLKHVSITVHEKTDYPGNDYDHILGITFEQCLATCDAPGATPSAMSPGAKNAGSKRQPGSPRQREEQYQA